MARASPRASGSPGDNLFAVEPGAAAPVGYATVAPEQGIDTAAGGLTYAIPPWLADLAVGERVVVPLGKNDRPVAGYVLDRLEQCPLSDAERPRIKPIKQRDERAIQLPEDLVRLARWIAGYYCCPLGMVFATMLPAAVKHGTGVVTQTVVRAAGGSSPAANEPAFERPGQCSQENREPADNGGQDVESDQPQAKPGAAPPKLSRLQRAVLEEARRYAETRNPWIEMKTLAERAGAKSSSPVKQLIEKGVLESKRVARVLSELDSQAQQTAIDPTRVTLADQQQQALDHLIEHLQEGFSVHLLHGVTGSGKTEVYLRVLERALGSDTAEAASAIVLVPEIALTPQTVARFLARFPRVAVLHSGLTAAQRHAQWRRIQRGEANIVVGARSAIFAPVRNLAMIIVDEEHESSYKQDQLPRYHGRDVAIKRAQLWDAPVVLGSATPSLESFHNAGGAGDTRAHYHLVRMPRRVTGMQLPAVELVDMQQERRQRRGLHLISQRLEHLLHWATAADQPGGNGQAILLLNRRGYANYLACPDHNCGWMMRCDHCDAAMVYHKDKHLPAGGVVRCHHCTAEQRLPATCPVCQKRVTVFGHGTQRVEEELGRKFPGLTYLRMDSDTMRTGRDYERTLQRFCDGEVDVLLGTQMIAKGLDFAGVRLVGVVSGDTALHMPDFRASERTFQLIAQVAGRAGRSDRPGRVIVQTFSPDEPAINAAASHDYDTFATRELNLRAEMDLPPVKRMARLVTRDLDHDQSYARAQSLFQHLQQYQQQLGTNVAFRGPMPCPIARVADYYRHQIEMTADTPTQLQSLLTALRNARLLVSDMHTAVDVDPVALL